MFGLTDEKEDRQSVVCEEGGFSPAAPAPAGVGEDDDDNEGDEGDIVTPVPVPGVG